MDKNRTFTHNSKLNTCDASIYIHLPLTLSLACISQFEQLSNICMISSCPHCVANIRAVDPS